MVSWVMISPASCRNFCIQWVHLTKSLHMYAHLIMSDCFVLIQRRHPTALEETGAWFDKYVLANQIVVRMLLDDKCIIIVLLMGSCSG